MTRLPAAVAALLLLAACGGGDDTGAKNGGVAARTVEVKAEDTLKFDPATITAKAGEKITFRVTNTGKQKHEFVIGDKEFHDGHEAAANAGGGHGGHGGKGDGAAVELEAGETKTVEYTMPATAPTYACHVASHDDAGMTGTVTYS